MTYIDWEGRQMRKSPSRASVWSKKLALAIKKPFKRGGAHTDFEIEDRYSQNKHPFLPFYDPLPPTTGSVQLGEPKLQHECILFRLPLELRQLIYKHVFGPSLIHMGSMGSRLAHVRCQKWEHNDDWDGHVHWSFSIDRSLGILGVNNPDDLNDQLISLCLTCRQM